MGVCCSELSLATWELGHTKLLGAEMQGSVWPHKELLRPGGIGKNGAKIEWMLVTTLLAKCPCWISFPTCLMEVTIPALPLRGVRHDKAEAKVSYSS